MGTLCSKPRLRNPAGVSSQVAWEFLNWSELWFSPKSSVFPCVLPFFPPKKTLSVFKTWPPKKIFQSWPGKSGKDIIFLYLFDILETLFYLLGGCCLTCSNYISWISFGCSELGEMLLVDERMAAWGVNPGNQTVMTSNFCLKRVPPMSTIHCWTEVI